MIDGVPKSTGTCQVCERECKRPSSRKVLTGADVFMCETCWAVWYDGQTETEVIKHYSLKWPVDCIGAHATDDKESIENTLKILRESKNDRSVL